MRIKYSLNVFAEYCETQVSLFRQMNILKIVFSILTNKAAVENTEDIYRCLSDSQLSVMFQVKEKLY